MQNSEDLNKENIEETSTLEEQQNQKESTEETNRDFEAEINLLKDQLLRSLAETENIRRRGEKQIQDERKFAHQSFAKDLINVMENLYRALESVKPEDLEQNITLKNVITGVEMTKNELSQVFDKNGIKRINPSVGDPFDHNLHQAVAHIPDGSTSPGCIIQVMQAGYILHDRLIRPAMVGVAKEITKTE